MTAYKRGRTLRGYLGQADHRYNMPRFHPRYPRKQVAKNVATEMCAIRLSVAIAFHRGDCYQLWDHFNCNTDFFVYILKCPRTLTYVGKIIGPFKKWFQKHRSDNMIALAKTEKGAQIEQIDLNKLVAVHF